MIGCVACSSSLRGRLGSPSIFCTVSDFLCSSARIIPQSALGPGQVLAGSGDSAAAAALHDAADGDDGQAGRE